jgi:hypothetical protein
MLPIKEIRQPASLVDTRLPRKQHYDLRHQREICPFIPSRPSFVTGAKSSGPAAN